MTRTHCLISGRPALADSPFDAKWTAFAKTVQRTQTSADFCELQKLQEIASADAWDLLSDPQAAKAVMEQRFGPIISNAPITWDPQSIDDVADHMTANVQEDSMAENQANAELEELVLAAEADADHAEMIANQIETAIGITPIQPTANNVADADDADDADDAQLKMLADLSDIVEIEISDEIEIVVALDKAATEFISATPTAKSTKPKSGKKLKKYLT